MSSTNEILQSAKDIALNMKELVNDIESLDEHEHDADECRDCQTIREEADENHDHDTWNCSNCESMVDEQVQDRVGSLDPNDLMDMNWDLWQTVGEEAVSEYKERTESVSLALDELSQRVLGLYSTLEDTDVDTVGMAIDYITEIVYGVRETPKPDIIEEVTINLPSDSSKCLCGADHSVVDYNKED